jgi:hypothetical protein
MTPTKPRWRNCARIRKGWWADTLTLKADELEDGEEPATADVDGLRRFLEGKVLLWFERRSHSVR